MNERGVILLAVLLTLTLIAALAALMLRIGEADVTSLSAERALLQREVLLQSALVRLAGRLPAQDGTETTLDLPGGKVDARVFAAEGLLNPNRTRAGILQAGLVALGLSAARAEAVTRAMMAARKAANRPAFADEAGLRALFTPAEWQKVRLGLTLLGRGETRHVTRASRSQALPWPAPPPAPGPRRLAAACRPACQGTVPTPRADFGPMSRRFWAATGAGM